MVMTLGNMEILKEDRIQVQTTAKVFEGTADAKCSEIIFYR